MQKFRFIAATAILLGSPFAAQATTGFACSFNGGMPGQPDAEGNVGPFQANGTEYKAEGETIRAAAREARLSCTAGEELGAQGCMFTGCADMAAADTPATDATATDQTKPVKN